ncbi:HNH endonuclease [Brevibacillus sp. NSP2.1]|uniref:HNH endonuclease n=1 Tax=Brevibacillus TaxID=55080 RepID=UPI0013987609|nr:HNH endonuclease signature motif containing protein [Brevibacillus sp. NSP2.1]QHZ55058.1 HNH endonuclease [Brevibacillus sp. NSP2.1]
MPISIAEGISLEELAEALDEPRILESKNVTILGKEEIRSLSNVVGERKKVYGAKKDDDSKIDYVAKESVKGVQPFIINAIAFDHYMTSDFGNGEVYSNIEVSAVVGDVASVSFTHSITRSNYENGSYKTSKSKSSSMSNPRVGRSHQVYANSDTAWWSGYLTGTFTSSKGTTRSIAELNGPEKILTNTLGDVYPDYVDPQSNIELIKPDANLVKKKRQRESNYRSNFINYYELNYGRPQYFDWTEVEIHHMIPLEYYGSNDVDNLIPLLKKGYSNDYIMYHHEVTNWWNNY